MEISVELPPFFALKHGDMFVVADRYGDICGEGDGLFANDTRLLSRWRLLLSDERLSFLGGAISQDNVRFTAHLTNHPLPQLGGEPLPEGVIHVERNRVLWKSRLYERISLKNFSDREGRPTLTFLFGADFRDIFEVRGQKRSRRGKTLPPKLGPASVLLAYRGLDDVERTTAITFSDCPGALAAGRADFDILLPPYACRDLFVEIGLPDREAPTSRRFREAQARARSNMRRGRRRGASLRTSGRLFNEWIERSRADLALLTTELPTGPYPYAGIPWFSTPFGRDAIITALELLWLDPSLARGVLQFLANHQAHAYSQFQAAEPGKILHEKRAGEMTSLHELPFGCYYGGADTTPLYVMLAGAYAERTDDMALIERLWPSLMAAMEWIEGDGDSDGDGFLDYTAGSSKGLINQGWKDSNDSIFHADGALARGAVAVVEIQGYVFAACCAMARLCERRGNAEEARHWRERAQTRRAAVEETFWMPEKAFYAIARDASGLCDVLASNPGHLLYCGLPTTERAQNVMSRLMSPAFNTGWGIRTLASGEPRFNPMSYHNGSIWPHDTAIAAAGMARYGERAAVIRLLAAAFEVAVHFEMRLPELFCGFERKAGEMPVPYPVACLPQAWSAGCVFLLLQACLGIRVKGFPREIHVQRPCLPIGVDYLKVCGITIGDASVDIEFQRVGERVVAGLSGRQPASIPVLLHM